MTIIFNDIPLTVNDNASLKEVLSAEGCSERGTAVAVNNKLIKKDAWETTRLHDNDNVVVINAAYGG